MIVDEETYLEHYGIKGMKWGVRRDNRSDGTVGGRQSRWSGEKRAERKAGRQRNRELNYKSRVADRKKREREAAKRVKSIDKARERIKTGETKKEYMEVRKKHAQTKREVGSREARKILNEARAKYNIEYAIATQTRDNREAAKEVAAGFATQMLVSVLNKR